MRLYEISDKYEKLIDQLYDAETGEINSLSVKELSNLQQSSEEKCIAIASFIENMEYERKAIEEAKNRMARRESLLKKKISSIKTYMLSNMERLDIKKISSPYFDITLCKNPPSVEIYDETIIPKQYHKVEIKFDVAKLRHDLLNGIEVKGARLINKKNVKIK